MASCGVGRAELGGSPSPIGRSRSAQRPCHVRWGPRGDGTLTDPKRRLAPTPRLGVAAVDLSMRVFVGKLVGRQR